jgi:hypothetical protein
VLDDLSHVLREDLHRRLEFLLAVLDGPDLLQVNHHGLTPFCANHERRTRAAGVRDEPDQDADQQVP